jgi:hypothetical protein
MSTISMPRNKDEVARELSQVHFKIERGMRRIFRLLSPGEIDDDFKEPVKLLEVSEDTIPAGIRPLHFGAFTDDNRWYPPSIIVEITPDEFLQIRRGEMPLPNRWKLGREYKRKVASKNGHPR